jgi:antitoxin VapB
MLGKRVEMVASKWYRPFMTAVAKVFRNGRSQAVRLPKEFRVKGKEVYLRRTPEGILISERDPWDALREAAEKLSEEFLVALEKREKRPAQKRKAWPHDS